MNGARLQALQRAGDQGGFVALVFGVVADDPLARSELAPQVLLLAPRVVDDDRVGRVEDHLGAAVVLVEHDRGDVLERLLELRDVADVGAAAAVDRLVAVADDGDLAVVGGEEQGDLVLRHVRVLVLVDQDVLEAALVVLEHLGVLAEQLDHLHQQVVEVHRPGLVQAGLVLDVDLAVLALERVRRLGHGLLRG